jgi:hypothetical protein
MVRVARNQLLLSRINQQIERLQHDGADECVGAVRFHDGLEGAYSSRYFRPNLLDFSPCCGAPIRVVNDNLSHFGETEPVYDILRQDKCRSRGIDDSSELEMPHPIRGQRTPRSQLNIPIIGYQ